MGFIIGALKIIFLLGTLVIIHEFGHFIVAKACGMKVLKFSIGFGPKLFKKQGKETEYSIRVLPLGGFVQLEGEDESSNDPKSFNNKPAWQRILVLLAGVTVNILFALFIYLCINMSNNAYITTKIVNIPEDSALAHSMLSVGDEIYKVNGENVCNYFDLIRIISKAENDSFNFEVVGADNKREEILITLPRENDKRVFNVDFELIKKAPFGQNLHYAINETKYFLKANLIGLGELFSGNMENVEVQGIVGISKQISSTKEAGDFFYMMAAISLSLGIMNLIPIPGLDGGKILFTLVEIVRRKPISKELEGALTLAGFGILLALMFVVTIKDVINLF